MDQRHDDDLPLDGVGPAPWEAYQHFMNRAQAARAQLLRNTLYTCAERLRARICALAERLHISLCPLCC